MEPTAPYSPEQNGIAERYNRTILSHARAVIAAKKIPLKLWLWIFESIGYIINRVCSRPINKTPYEALLGSKPDISNIRILGSLIYRLIPKKRRDSKLEPLSEPGILIGFTSTNYQVYIPETDTIRTIRDIIILENETYTANQDLEDLDLLEEEDTLTSIQPLIQPAKSISIDIPSIDNREDYLSVDSENSEDDEQLVSQTNQIDDQLDIEDTIESIEDEPPIGPRRSSRIRDQAYLASTAYLAINDDFEALTADIKEP